MQSSTSKLGNIRHVSTTLKSLGSLVGVSHQENAFSPISATTSPQKLYRSVNLNLPPMYCPTAQRPVKIYSFPTPDKVIIEAPTILSLLIEKVEPLTIIAPIVDPNQSAKLPMIAGPRMLTIRRKKMKKHKRRKRYNRDWFKYQKYHRQKKLKAEKVFRARMNDLMKSLENFDPMEHVTDTIKRAKREWSSDLTPSGKKKYPHWSEVMTIEELYNIEKSDYIDKRAGLPNEEDAQQIAQLRQKYELQYSRKTKVDGNNE